MELIILASARKHQADERFTDEDIHQAMRHVIWSEPMADDRLMNVGPCIDGRLLEVATYFDGDLIIVFHAMLARLKFIAKALR